MKAILSCLVGGVICLALVLAIAPSSVLAQEEVIELKGVTYHSMAHRLTTDAFTWFGREVENRTKGKVKFKWYLAGSLVKAPKTHDALMAGVTDFSILAPFAFMHLYPITEGLALPFVVDSAAHMADVGWEMYKTIPEMKEEYSKQKLLGMFGTAIINLHTKPPAPRNLEELRKLTLGVWTGPMTRMNESLGATGQFIRTADLYLAIQRGMIDGCWFPDAPMRSYRLIELVSNHTMLNCLVGPQTAAINLKTWKKLPPDVKKVFEDLSPSVGRLAGHTLTNEGRWVIDELKKRGDKFYYLPPEERAKWIEMCKPVHEEWIERLNKKGWDGRAIHSKMMAIAENYRKNPLPEDDWWGRTGRKTGTGFVPLGPSKLK